MANIWQKITNITKYFSGVNFLVECGKKEEDKSDGKVVVKQKSGFDIRI